MFQPGARRANVEMILMVSPTFMTSGWLVLSLKSPLTRPDLRSVRLENELPGY